PHIVGGLAREVVEPEGGEQARDAVRSLAPYERETVVLGDAAVREAVEASADLLDDAFVPQGRDLLRLEPGLREVPSPRDAEPHERGDGDLGGGVGLASHRQKTYALVHNCRRFLPAAGAERQRSHGG